MTHSHTRQALHGPFKNIIKGLLKRCDGQRDYVKANLMFYESGMQHNKKKSNILLEGQRIPKQQRRQQPHLFCGNKLNKNETISTFLYWTGRVEEKHYELVSYSDHMA